MPMLLALLVLGFATEADALSRKQCRLACASAINQCANDGFRYRHCKRLYVSACRKVGPVACPPPTTTSTTSSTSTTSTTVPRILVAVGTWTFRGTLVLNDCDLDASSSVVSTIRVTQTRTLLAGAIGTLPAEGEILDADSWQMFGPPSCDSLCCAQTGVRADRQSGDRADGSLAFVAVCDDGLTCTVGWVGPLTR